MASRREESTAATPTVATNPRPLRLAEKAATPLPFRRRQTFFQLRPAPFHWLTLDRHG